MSDSVNHPKHYNSHPSGVECIDVNEHFSGNVAAAIKYLWRKDDKHPVPFEDLQKAEWYLARELQRLAVPTSEEARKETLGRVREADHGILGRVLQHVSGARQPDLLDVKQMLDVLRAELAFARKGST